ncbi:UNVERIFIED_CONTAM: hypothetical protein NCL1_26471 [Trichonephila clavipes]
MQKMKAYYSIMVALCVIVLCLQAVEMSPRARRQSDNDNLISLVIPKDLLTRLLEGLLGALGLGAILGGGGDS